MNEFLKYGVIHIWMISSHWFIFWLLEDDTEEEGGADIQPVPPQIPAYQPLPPHHQPHPPGAHFLNLQNMHVVPMAFGDDDEGKWVVLSFIYRAILTL